MTRCPTHHVQLDHADLRPRCSNATWLFIAFMFGAATVAVLLVPAQ